MTRHRAVSAVVGMLLVLSLIGAGVGIVKLAGGADDTKVTADDAAAKAGGASAAADTNAQRIVELQKAVAREAAERARLRALIVSLGGNPGPDLARDTNRDGDVDLGTPTPSPSPRRTTKPSSSPSPRPPPSHAPSPSPSPTCVRVPPVPLAVCR